MYLCHITRLLSSLDLPQNLFLERKAMKCEPLSHSSPLILKPFLAFCAVESYLDFQAKMLSPFDVECHQTFRSQ